MSNDSPLIVAVVPVFNRLEITKRFIDSFRSLSYLRKMLVICDDGSTDGTGDYLRQQPDVVTVNGDGNLWWSGGTNAAVREALKQGAEYVVTINDDSEFEPDYLDVLLRDAQGHPGTIMASSLTQLQKPDRYWSLGASYLNYGHLLYVNDCCGASSVHIKRLMQPIVIVDTMPGNGVLYPAGVFEKAGYFDETWTPQYHGDTLFVHRAAEKGCAVRLSLGAVVKNDMGHHLDAKNYDPLLSIRSPHYAPAVYKSIEEREGPEAALDFLGGLAASSTSQFCPEASAAWKRQQRDTAHGDFVLDPHFAHTLPGGAFSFLGYHASKALSISRHSTGTSAEYQVSGRGILKLMLRIRTQCVIYCFVITDRPLEHLDAVMPSRRRGQLAFGKEWITFFSVAMAPADMACIYLAVLNADVPWRGLYLALEANVAEEFREPA